MQEMNEELAFSQRLKQTFSQIMIGPKFMQHG